MRAHSLEADRWFVRSAMLAAAGAVVVSVSIGFNLLHGTDRDEPSVLMQADDVPVSAPAPAAIPAVPSFDVVRVTPAGDAVMAGRGTAGAQVSIRMGERTLGTVTADAHGEWILVPEQPLPAGSHRLFAELSSNGGPPQRSIDDILVVVPDRGTAPGTALPQSLVMRMRSDGTSSLLDSSPASGAAGPLTVERLDEDEAGQSTLVGRATPGARVRVRVDGRPLGEVAADTDGVWRLPVDRPFAPGNAVLSAEQIGRRGAVEHQTQLAITFPANRPPLEQDRVLVQAGDTLWQIARAVYGRGAAYSVIFTANRAQIEDPDRIYPGQRFQLPASSPAKTAAGRP